MMSPGSDHHQTVGTTESETSNLQLNVDPAIDVDPAPFEAPPPKQMASGFAVNTSESPQTPALSMASSIPSRASVGPITPPETSQGGHGFPGLSPHYTISPHYQVRLHPLLESAALNWDLIENPSTITLKNYLLPRRLLVEQATTPPLPALSITSIHLPWPINIRASNGSYVTLRDFVNSIYYSLRTNINDSEFNLLPHEVNKKMATQSYELRYRRFRYIYGHDGEKRDGMKRVDFLMGRTRFKGISTELGTSNLQLNVDPAIGVDHAPFEAPPPNLLPVSATVPASMPKQMASGSSSGWEHEPEAPPTMSPHTPSPMSLIGTRPTFTTDSNLKRIKKLRFGRRI